MKWVKMKRHAACVKSISEAYASNGDDVNFLIEGDIDQAAEWEVRERERDVYTIESMI
jgi:hypothetical protein